MGKKKSQTLEKGSYLEFLKIAIPLILTTSSWSIQQFIDRMFLSWYSASSIAAATPAGTLNFTIISLFLGTIGYVSTFVAQYYGAKKFDRIGPCIWQAIYIAVISWGFVAVFVFFSKAIFSFSGHNEVIREQEVAYFNILCLGSGPIMMSAALSGFYAGIGRTWPIMWVNLFATFVNIIFDIFLIFGVYIFPELGIVGAAIATVISGVVNMICYVAIIFRKKYNKKYRTLSGYRFDGELLMRIMKYGFPVGVQFFIDMFGFAIFLLLVGRLGIVSLAATNIAFNVEVIAFMPMIGSGIAVSMLVGRYLGENRVDLAKKCTYSGFHLVFIYMFSISIFYFFTPEIFVIPFTFFSSDESYKEIFKLTVILLKFVAVYSVFDTFNIMFSSALKGAGDTKFVMYMIILLSFFIMILPTYILIVIYKSSILTAWVALTIYAVVLGLSFYLRFLSGKWESMRVIEHKAKSYL